MTEQGSLMPPKDHSSSPAMDPNQEEIPELPEKVFRRLIIKLNREALEKGEVPEKGEAQCKEVKKKIQEVKGEIFHEYPAKRKK